MSMVNLRKFFLLLLMQDVIITFCQTTTEACEPNVITSCVNNTKCAQDYGEVYNTLASQQNHFNISQALYPANWSSSVLVHVRLYGANQTENCTPAAYTWSMSCLYTAFPAIVLELLSLGSIMVRPRTQELNITIPPLCCNVTEHRRKIIIKRVLAALQDLAVSPKIQDPRLNTAECVIEGHEPNIKDTGRHGYILATLFLSCAFSFFFGPLLALITLIYFHKAKTNLNDKHITAMVKAVKWVSCRFMLLAELGLLFSVVILSVCGKAPWEIYLTLIILPEGFLLGLKITNFSFLPENKLLQISIFIWASLTAYHFCWLVIGIITNALWGVTVLLFVSVIIAAFIFTFYVYFYYKSNDFCCRNVILCSAALLSIGLLVALVIVAGQTVFGRDTTDDVVKAMALSVTTAFISWVLSDRNDRNDRNRNDRNENEGEEIPLYTRNWNAESQEGVTPYNRLERGTFLRLEVNEGEGISRVEVYERVGITRSIRKGRENTR